MIHLGLTFVYLVISLYYLFTPTLMIEQRLHATCCAFLMLYSIVRSFKKMNDLVIFFVMHWALYIIDGGRGVPFWMIVHMFTLFIKEQICLAETVIYHMTSEIHRVLPFWHYEFIYTHDALPRLALTTAEQRVENDMLHGFVEIRSKHEYPAQMTKEEKIIWKISDNKSVFLDRERRSFIVSNLFLLTVTMYCLWWQRMIESIHYYFFIDFTLFVVLLTGWDIRLIAYHGVFAVATFYLQFKLFNSSLKRDNVVVH